jgi:tetratricopeptide (TPR) repeat protein
MLRKRDENSAIETSEMEKQLGECFKIKNWKVKVITQEEANTINGDVDIIVEDDSDTLFVQLKRTFLRLNTEDIYNESILVDGPGRKQLVDAEAFLTIQNEIYNIKYPITKWLVSTSFENVNSEIDECRKINYFELINAISNPETKTLKQLIEDLVQDKSIRALYNSVISAKEDAVLGLIIEDFGLPLASFELKEYKKAVFTLKKETSIRYKDVFDKAIDLDKNGNKEKAISLLEKCIAMDEKDAEAFGALANVYADVKNYSKAFYSFEAALRLLPNDPMITRNYALALIESGNFFQGISLQLQLLTLFPFLGDTNYEIKHNMILGVHNRKLNENEFKTLNKILMDLE